MSQKWWAVKYESLTDHRPYRSYRLFLSHDNAIAAVTAFNKFASSTGVPTLASVSHILFGDYSQHETYTDDHWNFPNLRRVEP